MAAVDEGRGGSVVPARPGADGFGQAGGPQDRVLPGDLFQTAPGAAGAGGVVAVHRGVPELAGETVQAAQELAPQDDAGADPDLSRDVHEVGERGPVGAAVAAEPELAEGGEVRLVVQPQVEVVGQARTLAQLLEERHVAPAEVGGGADEATAGLDQTRDADRDPRDRRRRSGHRPAHRTRRPAPARSRAGRERRSPTTTSRWRTPPARSTVQVAT